MELSLKVLDQTLKQQIPTNYIKDGLQATPNPIKFIGRVSMGSLNLQEYKDASSWDFDISKLHDTVHNCHQCPLKKPNLTVIV
jgi:hypothetical protein